MRGMRQRGARANSIWKNCRKTNQQSSVILYPPEVLQCIVCFLMKHQTHVGVKHHYCRVSSLWFQHILVCLSPTSDFLLHSAGQTCWFYGSGEKKKPWRKHKQSVCLRVKQSSALLDANICRELNVLCLRWSPFKYKATVHWSWEVIEDRRESTPVGFKGIALSCNTTLYL